MPMEIGETLYVPDRHLWRSWLAANHASANEIWLVQYKKHTGKPSIPYGDAVEEALCYGWIDSIAKYLDEERSAQRYTPRRKNSNLSELNKERIRRMIELGKMTEAGLNSILQYLEYTADGKPVVVLFKMPTDILTELKSDPQVWQNFENFPEYYKHIRIGFIDGSRNQPDFFRNRLDYFIRMTRQNKKFGMMQ
jgi:uncharacterized protein YdeI (YjbR/CyaY-like superfamily)